DVRRIEAPVAENGCREGAIGLRDEMLNLLRQQAADLDAQGWNIATHDRKRSAAAEREQRALLRDAHFHRILGHREESFEAVLQAIAAERFESAIHLHVDELPGLGLMAKAVKLVVLAISGNLLER